jgi:hypothetical protein
MPTDRQVEAFEESVSTALSPAHSRRLDRLGEATVDLFKSTLGRRDVGWPELSEYTQAERERQGYSPDEPLVRSGLTQDSFTYEAEMGSDGLSAEVIVGIRTNTLRSFPYDSRIRDVGLLMVWHEQGTATEPPRPVLPLVAAALDRVIEQYLTSGRALVETGQNKV